MNRLSKNYMTEQKNTWMPLKLNTESREHPCNANERGGRPICQTTERQVFPAIIAQDKVLYRRTKMDFNDEKDYIMRIIKEMVRVLFSLMLGKQYQSVELPAENKYEVSGKALEEFEEMVDQGLVNEAENLLLERIDYTSKEEVLAALLFYQYVSEKEEEFLTAHNYSKEEVLDGIKRLAEHAGHGEVNTIFTEI